MAETSLNSNQARRLSVTCRYIDKLLADMESALYIASSRQAFPDYVPDITPEERCVIENFAARIRAQLVRILDSERVAHPEASIPVSRSLHTSLTFIAIAAEELHPRHMRGYGEVSSTASAELNEIAETLLKLVREFDRYVIDQMQPGEAGERDAGA